MKKTLQFFIFILSLKIASAQITITSASMPSSGDTVRYSNCAPQSVNTTVTGTNFFWNYDTLVPQSQGMDNYLAAYLTPYAFYFLGLGQYGMKIADSVGFSTYKFYDVYSFYKKTTSYFAAEGTGFKYQGVPLASTYSDKDELYTLPMTYSNHDSTTYKVTTTLSSNLYYSQVGYRINDVDGWGVIKTPYDSVACLRLVSTAYGKDSINFNGFGFSFPNVQRAYKWVSTTEKIPMLEVNGPYNTSNGNFTPVQARYRDNIQIFSGVNQIPQQDLTTKLFPNPAGEQLFLFTKNPDAASVSFYDLSGKLVASYQLSNLITTISTHDLANGCYFYSVKNKKNEQVYSGKVVVSK